MPAGTLEIFVKLDGIDGESTVRGHENETIVLSYEQSIDHPAPPLVGGGAAAGRPAFSGVRLRKPVDKGSIPLLLACAAGAQYPLGFDTLATGADSAGFLDEVTLSYAKIRWEYQPVSPSGGPAPSVKGGWDLKLNKKI